MREGRYHGPGEYAKAVFAALVEARKDVPVSACYRPKYPLDEEIRALCRTHGIELLEIRRRADLGALLTSGRFQSFYSGTPPIGEFAGVRRIYTIHGLRKLEVPTDRYRWLSRPPRSLRGRIEHAFPGRRSRRLREQLRRQLAGASVVVPSQHTRKVLLETLPELFGGEGSARIHVLYSPRKRVPAWDSLEERERTHAALNERLGVAPGGYMLLVSANRWTKNAVRAVRALDGLFGARPQLTERVVVLGSDAMVERMTQVRHRERFVFHDFVNPRELELLYEHARLFLYPSLQEGFGYAALEAMKHGTPVAAAEATAIPEICGDGVAYFDPYSEADIERCAGALLGDGGALAELGRRGRERSRVVAQEQDRATQALVQLILSAES